MRLDLYHHTDPKLLDQYRALNDTLRQLLTVLQPDFSSEDSVLRETTEAVLAAAKRVPPEQKQ